MATLALTADACCNKVPMAFARALWCVMLLLLELLPRHAGSLPNAFSSNMSSLVLRNQAWAM